MLGRVEAHRLYDGACSGVEGWIPRTAEYGNEGNDPILSDLHQQGHAPGYSCVTKEGWIVLLQCPPDGAPVAKAWLARERASFDDVANVVGLSGSSDCGTQFRSLSFGLGKKRGRP